MLQYDKSIYNLSFPPKDAAQRASIENSDHAARMHMLIWVFNRACMLEFKFLLETCSTYVYF